MKLHRKRPPKHVTRSTIPRKGLPTPAKIHKQVREARTRAGRRT